MQRRRRGGEPAREGADGPGATAGAPSPAARLAPELAGFSPDVARRIALAVACGDCDAIPKVAGAGELSTSGGAAVQVMHNGVVVGKDGYFGAWMREIIRCLRGHHEPQEELVFHEIVRRLAASESRPAMIELGSHWAYYSLWFRREMPDCPVVALEPDPEFLEVGRRNFALNGQTATFVHGAIGAGTATAMVFDAASDGRRYEVPRFDLQTLMDLAGLERVSLVLADIQGAETSLLAAARPLLAAGAVRTLIVSTHHHSISASPTTHQDVLSILTGLGAHVIAEHSVGESFSGDGLVAVSFDPADRDLTVPISYARQRDSLFGELEHDLAAAMHGASRCEAALRGELVEAREALARIESSRTWRWSATPRRVYRRLREVSHHR